MSTATLRQSRLSQKKISKRPGVRWCPGCGDYAILSAVQSVFPELGIKRENFVVVSALAAPAAPVLLNTFGFHTIHGRAPAVATGIKSHSPRPGSLGRHR